MENLGITLPELETSTILPSASIDGYILSIEKWVALCTLTFASIAFGLLPRWIFPKTPSASGLPGRKDYTQRKSYPRALALLSSFSGGVLLATTMLHILPEVREKAEHVAVSIFGLTLPTGFPLLSELLMLYGFCIIYLFEVVAHFFLKRHHNLNNNELSNKSLINGVEVSGQEGVKKAKGSWRVLISLVALSFHAVMEGVAVGVQHASRLWYAFGAVASHKFIISFCLGMELVRSNASPKTLIGSIVTFSIVSPIGIILGSSAQATMDTNSSILVLIEGLACGTLLYVVFFEILTTDQHSHQHNRGSTGECDKEEKEDGLIGFFQFTGTLLGILLSTWLMSSGEPHSHEFGDSSHGSHD